MARPGATMPRTPWDLCAPSEDRWLRHSFAEAFSFVDQVSKLARDEANGEQAARLHHRENTALGFLAIRA